ncbi:hypothetical protein NUV30_08940 [Kocuria rhizophila]|uniref:hypothetical protein n=1 Tax=Kocuria TaxID=57493 RepID=UPI00214F654A|nr:hypothetical protein [Kocuria rhizophila]MCR4526494.1 hypothetical protein [Kocuria rhizophila]WIW68214.1 hypothetical protein P8S73_11145 [Kocuria sp. ChxB]
MHEILVKAVAFTVPLAPSLVGAIIAFGLNAMMERGRVRRHHGLQVQDAALKYVDDCRNMNRQNVRNAREAEQYQNILNIGKNTRATSSLNIEGRNMWTEEAQRQLDRLVASEETKVETAKELRLSDLSVSFLAPGLNKFRVPLTEVARSPKTAPESDPYQWDREYQAEEERFLQALRIYVGTPKAPKKLTRPVKN